MELTADKELTVTSAKGKVTIAASQEVLLTSGGAYIRLKDGNIEVHAPGTVSIKGASHEFSGPARLTTPIGLPIFPEHDESLTFIDEVTKKPLAGKPYEVHMVNGWIFKGVTNAEGRTERINTAKPLKIIKAIIRD
jgi:type VI secretion system secreted protein VgrG